jgi:hypothetical protein
MKPLIVLVSLLFPTVGLTCQTGPMAECREQIVTLLTLRYDAIQTAFGDISFALPEHLSVKIVGSGDKAYEWVRDAIFYAAEHRQLLVPRSMLRRMRLPTPLQSAAFYWPFYLDKTMREAFPIVEHIDNAIWAVFLHEAARANGHTWPHGNCHAADITRRLPCHMLLNAAARYVKVLRDPFFNENRLDRIWPDDVASFAKRNYSPQHSAYADIVRLGGIPLLRPLIAEFGLPRVLAYVAQNPLVVEDNSLRSSALRYKEQARNALAAAREPNETSRRAGLQPNDRETLRFSVDHRTDADSSSGH